jgi:hypothetical protein
MQSLKNALSHVKITLLKKQRKKSTTFQSVITILSLIAYYTICEANFVAFREIFKMNTES